MCKKRFKNLLFLILVSLLLVSSRISWAGIAYRARSSVKSVPSGFNTSVGLPRELAPTGLYSGDFLAETETVLVGAEESVVAAAHEPLEMVEEIEFSDAEAYQAKAVSGLSGDTGGVSLRDRRISRQIVKRNRGKMESGRRRGSISPVFESVERIGRANPGVRDALLEFVYDRRASRPGYDVVAYGAGESPESRRSRLVVTGVADGNSGKEGGSPRRLVSALATTLLTATPAMAQEAGVSAEAAGNGADIPVRALVMLGAISVLALLSKVFLTQSDPAERRPGYQKMLNYLIGVPAMFGLGYLLVSNFGHPGADYIPTEMQDRLSLILPLFLVFLHNGGILDPVYRVFRRGRKDSA